MVELVQVVVCHEQNSEQLSVQYNGIFVEKSSNRSCTTCAQDLYKLYSKRGLLAARKCVRSAYVGVMVSCHLC